MSDEDREELREISTVLMGLELKLQQVRCEASKHDLDLDGTICQCAEKVGKVIDTVRHRLHKLIYKEDV